MSTTTPISTRMTTPHAITRSAGGTTSLTCRRSRHGDMTCLHHRPSISLGGGGGACYSLAPCTSPILQGCVRFIPETTVPIETAPDLGLIQNELVRAKILAMDPSPTNLVGKLTTDGQCFQNIPPATKGPAIYNYDIITNAYFAGLQKLNSQSNHYF